MVEDDSLINQDLTTDADVNFASTTLSGDLVVNGGDITSATTGNAANVLLQQPEKQHIGRWARSQCQRISYSCFRFNDRNSNFRSSAN